MKGIWFRCIWPRCRPHFLWGYCRSLCQQTQLQLSWICAVRPYSTLISPKGDLIRLLNGFSTSSRNLNGQNSDTQPTSPASNWNWEWVDAQSLHPLEKCALSWASKVPAWHIRGAKWKQSATQEMLRKSPTLKVLRSLLHRPQEVWWFRHVSHTHWLSLQSPMQFDLLSFLFQYQHLHSASSAPTQGHHSWQPHGWDKGSRQTSSLHHVQCANSWIHWPGQRIVSTYAVSSDHGLDHMSAPPLHIQKTWWLRDRRKYLVGNSHSQKHKRFLSRKSWAEVMLPERSCGVATWRFSGRELEWQAISWLQTPWRGGKKQKDEMVL